MIARTLSTLMEWASYGPLVIVLRMTRLISATSLDANNQIEIR
jgi:hypothetical protein